MPPLPEPLRLWVLERARGRCEGFPERHACHRVTPALAVVRIDPSDPGSRDPEKLRALCSRCAGRNGMAWLRHKLHTERALGDLFDPG